ncbi:MAG: general secretion pathway protein GspK [Verrucomicrobia bacterium]|nr:MAG: general secretion pathway protein GspK [Verrucomicrobiota bacterium]
MTTLHRPDSHSSQGFALVAVLWLIAVLGMATMVALRVIAFDMELTAAKVHGARARNIAEIGIAVGSNPVVKRDDPLLHHFDEAAGGGYDVNILSEGGRFNINTILLRNDTALLRDLFISWGLELDTAQAITACLADWIDADDNVSLNGAEKDWYESQRRINQPFNRPFYNIDEMRLVRGMDLVEAVRPDWRNWFTVWSSGGLDLNDASAELIAAATGASVEVAAFIPRAVCGADGVRGTEDDVPFKSPKDALDLLAIDVNSRPDLAQRFTVNDTTTRIESTGTAGSAKRRITVVVRNRTGQPALLDRFEEIIP